MDRACPVRDLALLSHGQVIEALVANRLTSPAPLVHVEDWAREWAVQEIFGIDPSALGDDRIGRALDAIAPQLQGIVGSVGAAAIAAFGLDVARLHWDMTSISLFGAYSDPQEGFAAPRFGHPKDRRTDLLTELPKVVALLEGQIEDGAPLVAPHDREGRATKGSRPSGGATDGVAGVDRRPVGALSAA